MSLESWKKEFYPVKASECCSDTEAIEHGILKWTGYSRENLSKHNMSPSYETIIENDNPANTFSFTAFNCSLCLKYSKNECEECPLFLIGQGCLTLHHDHGISPYDTAIDREDPTDILEALKRALVYVEENS